MSETVLDASAVLALIKGEPGCDVVLDALPDAMISAVNLSEVAAVLSAYGAPGDMVRGRLDALSMQVVSFDEELAYASAQLRSGTAGAGLSLGDRACLALAAKRNLPALTADRAWGRLDLGIDVRLIR